MIRNGLDASGLHILLDERKDNSGVAITEDKNVKARQMNLSFRSVIVCVNTRGYNQDAMNFICQRLVTQGKHLKS